MKKIKIKLGFSEFCAIMRLIDMQIVQYPIDRNTPYSDRILIALMGEFYVKNFNYVAFGFNNGRPNRTFNLSIPQAYAFLESWEGNWFQTSNPWTRAIIQTHHDAIHKQLMSK